MDKSTLRSDVGLATQVEYSSAPIPEIDMKQFREQIHYQMSQHQDYVDDTNPENWLHRANMGIITGF